MTTTRQSLVFYAGNDYVFQINLGKTKSDGTPLNLSGASAKWTATKEAGIVGVSSVPTPGLAPAILKQSDGVGVIIAQDASQNWVLQVSVSHTDTAVSPGYYYHEAEVTTPDGKVATVTTGRLQVIATII
jgi:hypothetical protein